MVGIFALHSWIYVVVYFALMLDFADYGKRVVIGQDYAIDTIQRVLTANSKLADLGDPRRERILASFLFVGPYVWKVYRSLGW
jgi:hypothetical protein